MVRAELREHLSKTGGDLFEGVSFNKHVCKTAGVCSICGYGQINRLGLAPVCGVPVGNPQGGKMTFMDSAAEMKKMDDVGSKLFSELGVQIAPFSDDGSQGESDSLLQKIWS